MISVIGLIKLNLGEERNKMRYGPGRGESLINAAHLMNIQRSTERTYLIGREADLRGVDDCHPTNH